MFIEDLLQNQPIISAIKSFEDLKEVPAEKVSVLFILKSELSKLQDLIKEAEKMDALIFIHIDMINGIGKDKEAVKYLANIGVDGILTTKSYLIKAAKKEDLISIQRLFLLDSEALRTGVNIIKNTNPDLIEVLPGIIVPEQMDALKEKVDIPIIAGGLIRTAEQIKEILRVGVLGISTSKKDLWQVDFNEEDREIKGINS